MAPNSVNHQHSAEAPIAPEEAKASNHVLIFQQHLKLLKLRIAYEAAEANMASDSVNHQHSAKAPITQKEAKASKCALSFQQLPKLLKVPIACKAAEAYMAPSLSITSRPPKLQ